MGVTRPGPGAVRDAFLMVAMQPVKTPNSSKIADRSPREERPPRKMRELLVRYESVIGGRPAFPDGLNCVISCGRLLV